MRILELYEGRELEPWLRSLGQSDLSALNDLVVEKGGRSYLRCPIRQKDIANKPEECIRQYWIDRLIRQYGYPLSRIAVEYPITFGRDSSKRADIVVFDADRITVPYVIIEVKQNAAKDGKEQLRSYSHATGRR